MAESGKGFVFVPVQNHGKPEREQLRLIRRHGMLGKNKRKSANQTESMQWIPHSDPTSQAPKSLQMSFRVPQETPEVLHPKAQKAAESRRRPVSRVPPQSYSPGSRNRSEFVPSPPPALPLLQFADEVDADALELLSLFPKWQRAFSLKDFGMAGGLPSSNFREWLLTDVAYFHAILAVSASVQDFLLHREPSKNASFHLRKATLQLNQNLSASKTGPSDCTVATVLSLGIASLLSLDRTAMSAHGTGFRELLRLRGGLDGFLHYPQFIYIMVRLDLCLSLISGRDPTLTLGSGLLSSTLIIPPIGYSQNYSTVADSEEPILDGLLDSRLIPIFRDLRFLAQCINLATSGRIIMMESRLHSGIMLSQYQLFELQGTLQNTLGECVRMAMLAFLTTTFQMLGSRIKYQHASDRFRELCLSIEASTPQLRELMLWMLMVGAVAWFDWDEPWLLQKWKSDVQPIVMGQDWAGTRRVLERYMWIHVCNDRPGKAILDKIRQRCDTQPRPTHRM